MDDKKTKACTKCGIEKTRDEFHLDPRAKDNLCWRCKECAGKYQKQYREKNKEVAREYNKQYQKKNKKKIQKQRRQYRKENKEKIQERNKQYREENREKVREGNKQYREKNREKVREWAKRYHHRKFMDPNYKMKRVVSRAVLRAIKKSSGSKEGGSTWTHLPYTPGELREYLESKFEPWMNWANHGVYSEHKKTWQIDHIIPQSNFYYDTLKHPDFVKCWSLENLRPLESMKNLRKGNKY